MKAVEGIKLCNVPAPPAYLQAEWGGKVAEAQAAGERQLAAAQATIAARDQTIAQLQAAVEERDGSISQLNQAVEALEAGKAELERQVGAWSMEFGSARRQQGLVRPLPFSLQVQYAIDHHLVGPAGQFKPAGHKHVPGQCLSTHLSCLACVQVAALQGELLAAHHQRRQLEAAASQRQREWEAALNEERHNVAALQTQVRCRSL